MRLDDDEVENPYTPKTEVHPVGRLRTDGGFKKGRAKTGGRSRGAPNRVGGDLRQMIMNAAVRTGFIETDKDGKRIASGKDGCEGFLMWLCLNEPRVYAGLLVRIIPYYIAPDITHRIMTTEQVEAEFKRVGLPMDIIKRLQRTPARLDDDEVENPYTPKTVDVTPEGGTGNDTSKK
jgi:hypothetical protein